MPARQNEPAGSEHRGGSQYGADVVGVGYLVEDDQRAPARRRGKIFKARLGQILCLEHEALMDRIFADEPVESYTPMRTERMVFDANWKIYTDNFVEGYHIPGIHPQFFAAIDFEQFKTTDGGLTLLDSQVESLVAAMASFAPPSAGQTTLPQTYQDALAGVIAAN